MRTGLGHAGMRACGHDAGLSASRPDVGGAPALRAARFSASLVPAYRVELADPLGITTPGAHVQRAHVPRARRRVRGPRPATRAFTGLLCACACSHAHAQTHVHVHLHRRCWRGQLRCWRGQLGQACCRGALQRQFLPLPSLASASAWQPARARCARPLRGPLLAGAAHVHLRFGAVSSVTRLPLELESQCRRNVRCLCGRVIFGYIRPTASDDAVKVGSYRRLVHLLAP